MVFFMLFSNSKIGCISTSFEKKCILSHITKKFQALQFLQNCLSKKNLALKNIRFDIIKTVFVVDITFILSF